MIKKQLGFTIIELITVVIMIGILTVTVLPKFDGTASYEAHTHRAQLISALRLTQQRAMQQTDPNAVAPGQSYCHQLVFDNHSSISRYGIPNRLNCNVVTFPNGWQPDLTGLEVEDKYQVLFSISGQSNPSAITFDNMGRPIGNANVNLTNNCAGGCVINIQTSVETLKIKIESEGFIHAI